MDTTEKVSGSAEKEGEQRMDTAEKGDGSAETGGEKEKGSDQRMEEGEIAADATASGSNAAASEVLADYRSSDEEDGADDSDDSLIRETMRDNPSLLAGAQDGDGFEPVSD